MSDNLTVDQRLAAGFNVQHLIIDPLWQGGIIEVSGSHVAVLVIDLPVVSQGKVYIAPSLEALERFEAWARATRGHLLARLAPAATVENPSNYDGISPNQADLAENQAEIGKNPQKSGNGAMRDG
jgi:hypothetical protein